MRLTHSLRCWVSIKMALWLGVFVIFAFLEKCKLDYSILQKFKVTSSMRMIANSRHSNLSELKS